MESLFSDAEKAALVNDFQSVVQTFLRPLTIYQEATKTVIVSNPNYNPYQSYNQNNTQVLNTPNPIVISGRILYDKNQEWSFVKPFAGRGAGEGSLKVKDQTTRSVRVKVDYSGYMLLKDAKQYEIDGYLFANESIARPHGLFTPDSYTFYFVRSL